MEKSDLSTWLASQLEEKGWSARELARRMGVSHTNVNNAVNNVVTPSADFCIGAARVLGQQPERVLRLAGYLPFRPEHDADAKEAANIIVQLPARHRRTAMDMLRALAGRVPPEQPPPPPEPDQEPKPWQIRRELTEGEVETWTELFYSAPPSARAGLVLMLQEFVEYFEDIRRGLWEGARDVEPEDELAECREERGGEEQ